MTDRELMQQALDALNCWPLDTEENSEKVDVTVDALRARLAQPEPEPVATIGNWGKVVWAENVFPQLGDKMYAAPPRKEWQGLTDEERRDCQERTTIFAGEGIDAFARAIEAKLKEKNSAPD